MKTKFILHGGRTRIQNESNYDFYKEVVKDLSDGDKVLFVGFARKDLQEREEVFQRDKENILQYSDKSISIINATEENFLRQVASSQLLFISGGKTRELIQHIQKYPKFIDTIRGKTVIGISAGAYLLSTKFFLNSKSGVLSGLGILPIRVICHYGDPDFLGNDDPIEALENYNQSLELIVLEKTKWVIQEIYL